MGKKPIYGASLIVDIGETQMFTMTYMLKSVSESKRCLGVGSRVSEITLSFLNQGKNKIRQLLNLGCVRSKAIYI